MSRIDPNTAGGVNVCAFLDMIAHSEIGPDLLAITDDGYDVLVGSTAAHPLLFDGYADHPNIYSRSCNSTAAGRYQQMHRDWPHYRGLLHLPDFSPLSQDLLAIQHIRESRALDLIKRGQFAEAVAKCAHIWASLPGAGYGQHENKLDNLAAAFIQAGGVMA